MTLGTIVSRHDGFLFCRVEGQKQQVFVHSGALPPDQKIFSLPLGTILELSDIEVVKRGPRANRARVHEPLSDVEKAEVEAQRSKEQTTDLLGWISRLNADRGYGFIARDDREEVLYFHATALTNYRFNDLTEGLWVYFDIGERDGRRRAVNVAVAPTS